MDTTTKIEGRWGDTLDLRTITTITTEGSETLLTLEAGNGVVTFRFFMSQTQALELARQLTVRALGIAELDATTTTTPQVAA